MISMQSNRELISWNQVPVSKKEEVLAKKASVSFSAETSLSEKIQRIFNGAMFFIVGAKILTLIPGIATAGAKLGAMAFAAIGATSVLQIPLVITIAAVATKIIVAIAFILVIRKILAIAVWHIVYPVVMDSYYNKEITDQDRWKEFEILSQKNSECRRITLNKSGISYDAFAVEHASTKGNGKWAIIAGGNGWIGDRCLSYCAKDFIPYGFNILYVNGPGVGRSTGFPTSYSIGAGQEAGLQFLEKAVQAKTILMYGTSLGGGAQSEAIQSHKEFKKGINYIVWSHATFDKLSNVASSLVTGFAKYIFFLLGVELNGIKGAKRLQELGIRHIVTQNNLDATFVKEFEEKGTDGVIWNKDSLYIGLRKAGFEDQNRIKFYLDPKMKHNGDLPLSMKAKLVTDIADFVAHPLT